MEDRVVGRLEGRLDGAAGLPSLDEWTATDGTVWERGHPRWLRESDAARLQLRPGTLVAVERAAGPGDLHWLSPQERRAYWRTLVAGHLDEANGADVTPNADGQVFRASVWTEATGRRLILLTPWR